jgi:hypothetical protein
MWEFVKTLSGSFSRNGVSIRGYTIFVHRFRSAAMNQEGELRRTEQE